MLLLEIAEASLSPDADMRRFFLRSFYRCEYACDASGRLTKQTLYNSGGKHTDFIYAVIGITLPFFSYGGSSLFTTFAALGMVSGIHFRPRPKRNSIYY